ncbi:MAG TPA: hypothetical protein VNQ56_08465 [Pseudolabrys sp.]|jgi:hypothetical protein|nr:hypothetical protein [Pseudolabrys sp.]
MADSKIVDDAPAPRMATVTVQFDQQQRRLLDFLRAEGTFGHEDGEIIRNVVLDYLRQKHPDAGVKK